MKHTCNCHDKKDRCSNSCIKCHPKMNTSRTLKQQIENICDEYFGLSPSDKWDERVREAAANSILSLFSKMVEEAKPKDFGCGDDACTQQGIDLYESNLKKQIGGGKLRWQ